MQVSQYLSDEPATLAFGQALARACEGQGAWIYLSGELGAGKTTLVRGFLRELGYHGRVKSPTYTLVEPYELAEELQARQVYHFDFYRINREEELAMIGLEEYFHKAAFCLVEWPERAPKLLPAPDITLLLQSQEPGRRVQVIGQTRHGIAIIERFTHA